VKRQYFCDAVCITQNMIEGLRGLSQNDLQESFQHLYSRWQKCVVAHRADLKEI